MWLLFPHGVWVKLSWGILHFLRASLILVHAAFPLLHSHQQWALLMHTLSDRVEQNPVIFLIQPRFSLFLLSHPETQQIPMQVLAGGPDRLQRPISSNQLLSSVWFNIQNYFINLIWSTGTGCPGRLWSLLLWRCSRLARTRSCAACCRWPCFSRGVGPDDPQRSFPTPNILWFCVLN